VEGESTQVVEAKRETYFGLSVGKICAPAVTERVPEAGGFKRWRSPDHDAQPGPRGHSSRPRRVRGPEIEWKMERGRGIVWSRAANAKEGRGHTPRLTNCAATLGGSHVWKKQGAVDNPDEDKSKEEGGTFLVGTIPCKLSGGVGQHVSRSGASEKAGSKRFHKKP
jgi:hypothetical protein